MRFQYDFSTFPQAGDIVWMAVSISVSKPRQTLVNVPPCLIAPLYHCLHQCQVAECLIVFRFRGIQQRNGFLQFADGFLIAFHRPQHIPLVIGGDLIDDVLVVGMAQLYAVE